ncbi:acyltransferase family protein, partial [Bacteroides thetaiotaomicron]
MIFFLVIIGILYIFSFCSFNERVSTFNKEHVSTLKGVMAISIVAFHLFYQTDDWLFMFSSWGAPIVSMFYFISGYGLALNYRAKGNEYLSHFFKHRIWESLILPFLLVWVVNRIISGNISMSLLDELIKLLMYGETTLPYSWYVFSILLFYILFYMIASKKNVVIISFLCVFLYIALTVSLSYERCWYISALAFPLGIFYCKYEERICALWNVPVKYYVTVPLCLLLTAACVISKNEFCYLFAYIFIPIVIVCLCAKIQIYNRNIQWISNVSYEIYLCQGVSMILLRGNYFFVKSDFLYIIA